MQFRRSWCGSCPSIGPSKGCPNRVGRVLILVEVESTIPPRRDEACPRFVDQKLGLQRIGHRTDGRVEKPAAPIPPCGCSTQPSVEKPPSLTEN